MRLQANLAMASIRLILWDLDYQPGLKLNRELMVQMKWQLFARLMLKNDEHGMKNVGLIAVDLSFW